MFAATGPGKKKNGSTVHTHTDTHTRPILYPSIKTEVVLAPDQLEAGAWEAEEGDTRAEVKCGLNLLSVMSTQ